MTDNRPCDVVKSAHKRIDKLEAKVEDINLLATSIAVVDEKVKRVGHDVSEIKETVSKITDIPIKGYEKFIGGAIGALATGLVGAIIALILR